MKYTVQVTTVKALKPGEHVLLETEGKTLKVHGKTTTVINNPKVSFKKTFYKSKPASEMQITGWVRSEEAPTKRLVYIDLI